MRGLIARRSYLNKLTADYEYSRGNREKLLVPIQMQLEKEKTLCQFLLRF